MALYLAHRLLSSPGDNRFLDSFMLRPFRTISTDEYDPLWHLPGHFLIPHRLRFIIIVLDEIPSRH